MHQRTKIMNWATRYTSPSVLFELLNETVFIRKLYKSDSSELEFITPDLYTLSPTLKSCESVDSSNTRYLYQSYSSIMNSLSKPLNIKLYNEKWFDKPLRTSEPLFDYKHPTFDFPELILTPITSLFYLHFDTKIIPIPPIIEKFDTIHLSQYHQQI